MLHCARLIVVALLCCWPALGSAATDAEVRGVIRLACEDGRSVYSVGEYHHREVCTLRFTHDARWYEVTYLSEQWREAGELRNDEHLTFSIVELWQFEADGTWPIREAYMTVYIDPGVTFTGRVKLGMKGHALAGGYLEMEERYYAEDDHGLAYRALWQQRLDAAIRITLTVREPAHNVGSSGD